MPKTSSKPKCGKGQSCGNSCIEIKDTCKSELEASDVAMLAGVTTQLTQLKQKAIDSITDKDLDFEQLSAKYPFVRGTGTETETKFGNGVSVYDLTMKASDGSGDMLTYSLVLAKGRSFTVSDGIIKEFTASDRGGLYKEALAAAIRAKVEADLAAKGQPIATMPVPVLVVAKVAPALEQVNAIPVPAKASGLTNTTGRYVPAMSSDLLPGQVHTDLADWAKVDSDPTSALAKQAGADVVAKAILDLDKGYSADEANALGLSLKAWLSPNYGEMSKLMYLPEGSPELVGKEKERNTFSNAVQALRLLPSFTLDGLKADHKEKKKGDPGKQSPNPANTKVMNRWIGLEDADARQLIAKYKAGNVVSEDGMFAVSHLPAEQMGAFSGTANISYKVLPKRDGTTTGKALDRFKNMAYEGEVMFVPGTKFEVLRVEKGIYGEVATDDDSTAKIEAVKAMPSGKDKDVASIDIWRAAGKKEYYESRPFRKGWDAPTNRAIARASFSESDIQNVIADANANSLNGITVGIKAGNLGIPASVLKYGSDKKWVVDRRYLEARPLPEVEAEIFLREK